MRRQLQTWGLGLVAASPWGLGVARLYANPADPAVDVLTLWLAGMAWMVAVVVAGWLAGRDPEAHAGSGAWAGGNVGALAWLASPTTMPGLLAIGCVCALVYLGLLFVTGAITAGERAALAAALRGRLGRRRL